MAKYVLFREFMIRDHAAKGLILYSLTATQASRATVTVRRKNGGFQVCLKSVGRLVNSPISERLSDIVDDNLPDAVIRAFELFDLLRGDADGAVSNRWIRKVFRAHDESHLPPISGRFNATERAIRRAKEYDVFGIEYMELLGQLTSEYVNSEKYAKERDW